MKAIPLVLALSALPALFTAKAEGDADTIVKPLSMSSICEYSGSAAHGSYPVANAFNGNRSDRWLVVNNQSEHYAQAKFLLGWRFRPVKLVLTGLKDSSWSVRDPKRFIVTARNADDEEWVTLLDLTDIPAWTESEVREYALSADKAYSTFRFEIAATQGTDQYRGVSEIELECSWTDTVIGGSPGTPAPADGANHVSMWPALSWGAPLFPAESYRVYLGESEEMGEEDLIAETAERSARLPGDTRLDRGVTRRWRVDAVFPDGRVSPGVVWSFTTAEPSDEPIAVEDFESYSAGALGPQTSGGTGWTDGSWTVQSATTAVVEERLEYRRGRLHITGGNRALQVSANDISALRRAFERRQDSPIYMGFLVRPRVAANASRMLGMYLNGNSGSTTTGSCGTDVGWSGGKPTATIYAGNTNPVRSGAASGDFATDETHFIVVKITTSGYDDKDKPAYSSSYIYVDPSSREEPETPSASCYTGISRNDYFDKFILRVHNLQSEESFLVDELRIGSTFGSVIPPPPKGLTVTIR